MVKYLHLRYQQCIRICVSRMCATRVAVTSLFSGVSHSESAEVE